MKYVYLDFDGVLNPWPFEPEANPDYKFDRHLKHGPYNIHMSSAMIQDLVDVSNECGAEIVWCSTWCLKDEDVTFLLNNVIRTDWLPLTRHMSEYGNGFKHRGQEDHYLASSDGDRFVWIDDDALPYDEDRGSQGLYLAPDGDVGLTKQHLQQIKEWING